MRLRSPTESCKATALISSIQLRGATEKGEQYKNAERELYIYINILLFKQPNTNISVFAVASNTWWTNRSRSSGNGSTFRRPTINYSIFQNWSDNHDDIYMERVRCLFSFYSYYLCSFETKGIEAIYETYICPDQRLKKVNPNKI